MENRKILGGVGLSILLPFAGCAGQKDMSVQDLQPSRATPSKIVYPIMHPNPNPPISTVPQSDLGGGETRTKEDRLIVPQKKKKKPARPIQIDKPVFAAPSPTFLT